MYICEIIESGLPSKTLHLVGVKMVLQKFNLVVNWQINLNLLLQMVLWTVEIMSGLV